MSKPQTNRASFSFSVAEIEALHRALVVGPPTSAEDETELSRVAGKLVRAKVALRARREAAPQAAE